MRYNRAMGGTDAGGRVRIARRIPEQLLTTCCRQDRPALEVVRKFMRWCAPELAKPVASVSDRFAPRRCAQ